jgi:Arc/MetJ-type ribon-helix-helix transcriptional regulator
MDEIDRRHSPGMLRGMTMAKIAVSLPPELVRRARHAVRTGEAESVSAYVAAALQEKAKLDDLSTLLDEMLAQTGGPLTDRERRAADKALGLRAPRKGRR